MWEINVLPPCSQAELQQHGFTPSKGWKLSFANQTPQKEIPEVSEVPSALKDFKAFEQLAFSANGTKNKRSQRSESAASSLSANSTVPEDIKAWETSGTSILQTSHGDASMQVHTAPGLGVGSTIPAGFAAPGEAFGNQHSSAPQHCSCKEGVSQKLGRVWTPAQLPSSPEGPAPVAAAQGHEQTALRRSSGTSSLCYRFISVWINETVHTIPKKKIIIFYRPIILLSQYNATVKDLVSVNRRSNSDHQLSQISCTNTIATGLMPLPHKLTVPVQIITLPTMLFHVQKPWKFNLQKKGVFSISLWGL